MKFFSAFTSYILLLVLCVLMVLSVNLMLLQWVCLEINMLSIIPIFISSGKRNSLLMSVKYFISQSSVSLLMVLMILLSGLMFNTSLLIGLAMIFKLGLPPFHSWLMSIMMELFLEELFLIFTIQKMIPLIILSNLSLNFYILLLILIIVSLFILLSMNTINSLNFLLFLSSLSNGTWMVGSLLLEGVWLMFLFFYSFMLSILIIFMKAYKLNNLNKLNSSSTMLLMFVALQFFNLGGLPPFLGFMLKLMILKLLCLLSKLMSAVLLFNSFCMIYCYTSLFFYLYSMSIYLNKFSLNYNNEKYYYLLIYFSFLSLSIMWVV